MTKYHPLSDTESKAPIQLGVCIAFLAMTWISVSLRCYSRAYIIHSFGWDDAIMVIALIFFTVYCTSLIVIAYGYGGGTHTAVAGTAIYWIIVSEAFYILTTMALKISIGIFFLRIITKPWQKYTIFAIMVLTVLVSIFFFFFVIFMCGNPKDYLVTYLMDQCAPRHVQLALSYTHACWGMVTDWIYACLPVGLLWGTTMKTRKKITVFLILFLAVVGSAFSTVRVKYAGGLVSPSDFFWNAAMIAIWSCIECGAGITAGSLATLRPLLRGWFAQASRALSYVSSASSRRRGSRSAQKSQRSGTTQSRSENNHSSRSRPYEKMASDHSQDSSNGQGQQSVEARTLQTETVIQPTAAYKNSKTSLRTDTGTEHLLTITESFERESHWQWPKSLQPIRRKRSFSLDIELGPPFEMDRRSSHTIGDEEAMEIRRALAPPPRVRIRD